MRKVRGQYHVQADLVAGLFLVFVVGHVVMRDGIMRGVIGRGMLIRDTIVGDVDARDVIIRNLATIDIITL